MKNYTVHVTEYDTDEDDDVSLPLTLSIIVPDDITDEDDIEEYLADEISNLTGYCHKGFSYEK
jgi:hypothetical protein